MKTIIFISSLAGGGAERQCVLFFNEYSKLNPKTVLVFFDKGKYFDLIENESYKLLENKGFRSLHNFIEFKNFVKEYNPETIISFLSPPDIYCGVLKLLRYKFKWVPYERNSFYDSSPQSKVRKFLVKRFSNRLLANSEKGLVYWKSVGYKKEVLFAKNLVYFKKPKDINKLGSHILFVGRLEDQKNIKKLVKVFAILSKEYNYTCKIIGEGSYNDWIKDEISNNDKIQLLEFQKNITDYYKEVRAFISISNYEGTPNVVIENVFSGNKVIVSKIKEHMDILGEDYFFYVDIELSPEKLAAQIKMLIDKDIKLSDYSYFFDFFSKETSKDVVKRVNRFVNEDLN